MTRGREGQAKVLTHEEVERVLEDLGHYCGEKYRVLFAVAYYCAARIGESRLLEVRDIEWSRGFVRFRGVNTKTKTFRECPIAPPLEEILRPWWEQQRQQGCQFLFPNRSGKPITRQAAGFMLNRIADLRGIYGLSTHSFRRSMATHLRKKRNYDYHEIALITGHQSINQVVRYISTDRDELFSRYIAEW